MYRYKPVMLGFLVYVATACGISRDLEAMSDGVNSMKTSVKGMSDSLGSTSSALRQQAMLMSINEMMKPENLYFITLNSVSPAAIIPSAQSFGRAAAAEDILGLAFIWLTDVNSGSVNAPDQSTQDDADTFKLRRLTAVQTIVGMLPSDRVEELVKAGLKSRFESTLYAVLALRYSFISAYMLEVGALSKSQLNDSEYMYAMQSVQDLRALECLPFRDKLSFKLYGFFNQDLNQTVAVGSSSADYAKKIEALRAKNPNI